MTKSCVFEQMLQALPGCTISEPYGEYEVGYAETPQFRFRYMPDRVEIGISSRFDRWANSVDFCCTPVPSNQESFDALLAVLERARKERWEPARAFESIELWPYVRKQRRETASALRLSARAAAREELAMAG